MPGLTDVRVFQKKTTVYSSFGYVGYNSATNTIIVVFRGTDDINDWIANLDVACGRLDVCLEEGTRRGFFPDVLVYRPAPQFIKTDLWDTVRILRRTPRWVEP